jgi:hypothetical protein
MDKEQKLPEPEIGSANWWWAEGHECHRKMVWCIAKSREWTAEGYLGLAGRALLLGEECRRMRDNCYREAEQQRESEQ